MGKKKSSFFTQPTQPPKFEKNLDCMWQVVRVDETGDKKEVGYFFNETYAEEFKELLETLNQEEL